ncbi:hypothetical protein SERLA73DRAFT_183298, partial [Serpula lacrymans var. lacrymans S7.3]
MKRVTTCHTCDLQRCYHEQITSAWTRLVTYLEPRAPATATWNFSNKNGRSDFY